MRRILRAHGRLGPGLVALLGALLLGGSGLAAGLAADASLERPLTARHDDGAWRTTPRELGARVSVPDLVGSTAWLRDLDARRLAATLSPRDGDPDGPALPVRAPEDELEAWVEQVADAVERPARDARIEDTGVTSAQDLEVRDARPGLAVDRRAAAERLREALRTGSGTVRLPVREVAPEHAPDDLEGVLDDLREAVADALAEPVALVDDGRRWQVTPADLGARAHLGLEDAPPPTGDGGDAAPRVRLEADPEELEATIDRVAAEAERPPRDALLDDTAGRLRIIEERHGVRVERDEAARRLRRALREGRGEVELPTERTAPEVTADDYDRVLHLRQGQRRLELYVDGELARTWPVAVGRPGHATPTGRFTVGAKRHRPTWVNPSPDGWGSDLPRRVGPGPDNPLGVRALDWHQGGRDTMIRFHGTADRDSIGRASSHGCVRLTNEDVRELYDLVPAGTPIVSVR